jgi:hypothetical protein
MFHLVGNYASQDFNILLVSIDVSFDLPILFKGVD